MKTIQFVRRGFEHLSQHGFCAALRAAIYIAGSVAGKRYFEIEFPWGRFTVPSNPKKLGVGGILFSRRESFELHLKPYFADCRGAFVDIGANLGYWSLFVAECKAKRADSSAIFAFEPVPENFRLLQQNVRVSRNRAAIRTEQAALGAQFGLISMAASNDDPGSCFVNRNALGQIQQIRLDDYVGIAGLDRIGLIKMDVEGYEYDVLCGARNTILEHKPLVLCEVIEPYLARNGRTPAALFEFFAELGYAGTRVCAEGLNGKPGYFGNGDYLFCAT